MFFLVYMSKGLDCEQFVFCSKFCGEGRKEECNTNERSYARTLSRCAFFPTDFRAEERLFTVWRGTRMMGAAIVSFQNSGIKISTVPL